MLNDYEKRILSKWLMSLYLKKGATQYTIAKETGITQKKVCELLNQKQYHTWMTNIRYRLKANKQRRKHNLK